MRLEAGIAYEQRSLDLHEALRVYKKLSGAFNEFMAKQQKFLRGNPHQCVSKAPRFPVQVWRAGLVLLACGSGGLGASSNFSCEEISRPQFLKAFQLSESAPRLLRALLADQVEALKIYANAPKKQQDALKPCVQRRWDVMELTARELSPAALKGAESWVLLGRMRALQGRDDQAAESFRNALRFEPKNAEAIYYAAQRAQLKGEREQERRLLQGLTEADFEKRPELQSLFDSSFERLATLLTASEALKLIEGPWKKLDRNSLKRIRRGLEVADSLKDAARMERYFAEGFGPGELGAAPDWAYFLRARYFFHKGEMRRALENFDRSLKSSRSSLSQDYRLLEPWLDLAHASTSYGHLRAWSQFVLEQSGKELSAPQRSKVERYFVLALENGALQASHPMQDLARTQKLSRAPELYLVGIEVLLRQRAPLNPEGAFARRETAFQKARSDARYLQAQGQLVADAAYWEMWMDWEESRFQAAQGQSQTVFREFQKGRAFHNPRLLTAFFELSRKLHQKTAQMRDYAAKLKLVAHDPQALDSVRQAAQSELQALKL